jgi:peptidoglycan/xylan/chitin deacetylase (PgdA/CDA1 family)
MNRYVTISIDDGHPTDVKTAELLEKYGLAATFYIPSKNAERPVMRSFDIREIARRFEVGGHTLNHTPLRFLRPERAWDEIRDGKSWLEHEVGRPVVSFCYPRGKFNGRLAAMVQQAGFLGARTCLLNVTSFPKNPFYWGASTHAGNHSVLEGNLAGVRNYFRTYDCATEWDTHFMHALDDVEVHGGIAHLYMHSWEIDESQHWAKLERVFESISARTSLTKITNGALFSLWEGHHGCRNN